MKKAGGPEKRMCDCFPLNSMTVMMLISYYAGLAISELGKLSYLSYWSKTLAEKLLSLQGSKAPLTEKGDIHHNQPTRITNVRGRKITLRTSNPAHDLIETKAATSLTVRAPKSNATTSVNELSKLSGIAVDDVLETLVYMGILGEGRNSATISKYRLKKWAESKSKKQK